MTAIPDLSPAVHQLIMVLDKVADDQLSAPTPCERYTTAELIDHVNGLSLALTSAAAKDLGPMTSQAPSADGSRLSTDWRTRIPSQLAALADAWRREEAWEGMTQAGGVDLPGEVAGLVALNELVVHGWDVAVASGQPYDADPESVQVCVQYVEMFDEQGTEGLFGPRVPVHDAAPLVDRLVGLAGRDPRWQPGVS